MKKAGVPLLSCRGLIGETVRIRRCLLTGFFAQCARYDHTGLYMTLRDSVPFKVYKGSTVMYRKDYPKYVLFTDVLQTSIRDLSAVELDWLKEVASHYYDFGQVSAAPCRRTLAGRRGRGRRFQLRGRPRRQLQLMYIFQLLRCPWGTLLAYLLNQCLYSSQCLAREQSPSVNLPLP